MLVIGEEDAGGPVMRGDGAPVGFEGLGDLPRENVVQQRFRAFLEEIALPNEIIEESKDDGDRGAKVQHKEPGHERLGQACRCQMRL